MTNTTYLLVDATLARGAVIDDDRLDGLSERHKIDLERPASEAIYDPIARVTRDSLAGLILISDSGLVARSAVDMIKRALEQNIKVFVYWPREQALEVVDAERATSFRTHWLVFAIANNARKLVMFVRGKLKLRQIAGRLHAMVSTLRAGYRVLRGRPQKWAFVHPQDISLARSNQLIESAAPVPLPPGSPSPSGLEYGNGAYLRLDYWAPLISGGSYGHTCYVAQSLARCSADFTCFMAQPYQLLDDMGLRQVALPVFSTASNEYNLLEANEYYYYGLRTALQMVRPSYIYERICLGNTVGAALSQELSIPYIVEYNGSEISMRRSFDGAGYEFEEAFERAELAAFAQATVISVVSTPIREQLVERGIDPHKILVNPNGADPHAYAPLPSQEREALRSSLGFSASDRVVGFTGTFGGWHGIDMLAAAIPIICEGSADAKFLFIGDGATKPLVDEAVKSNGLDARCVSVGRVAQTEGARLLGACDIFVSPHNAHMVDSRFFGSPTKVFEYMSVAGGVVASDLEQIGEVLRPALSPAMLDDDDLQAGDARAVLCTPGDEDEFVASVLALVERPELCRALGANARKAVLKHHTWDKHVDKVWQFAVQQSLVESAAQIQSNELSLLPESGEPSSREVQILETGDRYKDETQEQWNADACGSHYVTGIQEDTLEWFLEVERYRYEEYGPWMPETMGFAKHAGQDVLEVGAGIGTDLAQFAANGARTTDIDLSAGHLQHARRNFELRGLAGRFVHQDAEIIPFDDASFDLVYSNGVIHHTPNTQHVIDEMWRVLRPGGKLVVMVYAENSYHYWKGLFFDIGIRQGLLATCSMGEIMSRSVELSTEDQRPLVKVYSEKRLRRLFKQFSNVSVVQRQLVRAELPLRLRWLNADKLGCYVGWNLVIKGQKSSRP